MKHVLIIFLVIAFSWTAAAQKNDRAVQEPCDLIGAYYDNVTFLDHSYNYELSNEIQLLRMKKRNVITTGIAVGLGVIGVGSYLAITYDWPMWIYVPCGTVVTMGAVCPFVFRSINLHKRARALEQQTAYIIPVNDRIDLGMTRYDDLAYNSQDALGFALRVKF